MWFCDRCHLPTNSLKGSYFSTENLCSRCVTEERHHPMYKHAVDVEHNAVKNGNYNFGGIGVPADVINLARERRGLIMELNNAYFHKAPKGVIENLRHRLGYSGKLPIPPYSTEDRP